MPPMTPHAFVVICIAASLGSRGAGSFGLQFKHKVVFSTRCLIHSEQEGGRRNEGQKFPSFQLLLLRQVEPLEEASLGTLHVL